MKIALLAALVLVSVALAAPSWQRVEPASPLPTEWRINTARERSASVHLTIVLQRRNVEWLKATFEAVSNPQHARYGQYLSAAELTAQMRPAPAVLARVQHWVRSAGGRNIQTFGMMDRVAFDIPVEAAEAMLNTKFMVLSHRTADVHITRAVGSYYAPEDIAAHIVYVAGVQGLPLVRKADASRTAPGDNEMFGPEALRARYQVSPLGGKSSNNSMAVAEFQGQYYSPDDLKTFWTKYVPYAPEATVSRVVGTNTPSAPGVEASLDIQYIMGVAPKVRAEFWSQASFDFWSDLTTWVGQLHSTPNVPWVHSVSYGSQTQYPSTSFRDTLNSDFMALGVRGISIIFASGDSGTGCFLCTEFVDSVPATLPAVTSVGATTFESGTSGNEIAVTAFGSGGGFSSHFDTQSWQKAAVQNYLSSGTQLPSSFYYNAKGRGNPDVAALGWGFAVVVGSAVQSVGGTSAAAPTFSGIIALLNDERLAAGKPTLGFLNPWLYSTAAANPNAFFDVTQGNNQDGCCLGGFNCAKGWDPVTGLGTPNFVELLKHI